MRRNSKNSLIFGAAVECVHTQSLIHDDLPCMDDDDFRRGVPACHVAFGEGLAILAGDALLTLAIQLVNQGKPNKRYKQFDYVREMVTAVGHSQMIVGQVVDLELEGKPVSSAQVKYIHERKTDLY